MTGWERAWTRSWRRAMLAGASLAWLVAAVSWRPSPVRAQAVPPPNTLEFYHAKVEPILRANCYRCHAGFNHRGNLQIDTLAGMLKGGKDGAVLVPGRPDQSLLIRLIRHQGPPDNPMPMPPKSKLTDADIATVTAWVAAGARMP